MKSRRYGRADSRGDVTGLGEPVLSVPVFSAPSPGKPRLSALLAGLLAMGLSPAPLSAQQPTLAQQAIAYVPTEGVSLSGPLSVANGRAAIGNNSTVTAADKSAQVTLARGGSLRICSSTSVHISRDALPPVAGKPGDQDDSGLMLALDRGALEANYSAGKYSDVLLTPDLRILISGPGMAQVKLRVNQKGDTCVDNSGYNAPYVTVSSLMDGGIYRVQPNQRVLFEHGSLQQVVDREAEPCGCPDAQPDDSRLLADRHVGGPSSTPADTAFPVAVSEGLAPPPAPPTTPVVPVGQAHAQVTATLSSDTPPGPPPAGSVAPSTQPALSTRPAQSPPSPRPAGFFHKLGHFFSHLFGQQ